MTKHCPICGLSRYSRERRPNGKTKCLECGFSAVHAVWDYVPPKKVVENPPAQLRTEEEIKAFLLGIRAAFILASKSRDCSVSAYGRTMLKKTDSEYNDRYKKFADMLAENGVVGCGVCEPT